MSCQGHFFCTVLAYSLTTYFYSEMTQIPWVVKATTRKEKGNKPNTQNMLIFPAMKIHWFCFLSQRYCNAQTLVYLLHYSHGIILAQVKLKKQHNFQTSKPNNSYTYCMLQHFAYLHFNQATACIQERTAPELYAWKFKQIHRLSE